MSIAAGHDAMQAPGTSKAPKTFDGDDPEVEDSSNQFEMPADAAKPADREKISGSKPAEWESSKGSLTELYPNTFQVPRYTRQNLEAFTAKTACKEITNEDELNKYFRDFIRIALWLVKHKKLTEDDRDRQFWFGFHRSTRIILREQLRISKPDHDISKPYDYKDVLQAGRYLFNHEAFDLDTRSGKTLWIHGMEGEEEGSEGDRKQKKKKDTDAKDAGTATEDLEPLIKKLLSLPVHDTDYAVNYAKLALYYPTIADMVPLPPLFRPAVQQPPPMPYAPRPAYALQAGEPRACAFCKWPGPWTRT